MITYTFKNHLSSISLIKRIEKQSYAEAELPVVVIEIILKLVIMIRLEYVPYSQVSKPLLKQATLCSRQTLYISSVYKQDICTDILW